jgi:hypothetical protein
MLTAGKWWATRAPGNATCGQATPCTWAQVNAHWPAAEINGIILFKVGGPWPEFKGNVDALKIGVGTCKTVFDFELSPANGNGSWGDGRHEGNC